MVVILKRTTMKRLIYILLSAAVMMVACEPEQIITNDPVVEFTFGKVRIETTDNSADIFVDMPYITVDGQIYTDAVVYMEYWPISSDVKHKVTEYSTLEDGATIHFALTGLEQLTQYNMHVVLDGGNYGTEHSDSNKFNTKEHVYSYSTPISCEVDTRGLYADITLKDVAYLVDDQRAEIAMLTFKYKRTADAAWMTTNIDGDALLDSKEIVRIPAEGEAWLEENCDYMISAEIVAAEEGMPTLTVDFDGFKTSYAEVTANISQPALTIEEEMLTVDVENVEVLFDGIVIADYPGTNYYIAYRKANSSEWSAPIAAEYAEGTMRHTMSIETLDRGKVYEFRASVEAGAKRTLCTSEVASITIPEEETPVTPPTPPTPPAPGDTDTSDIAGTWRLAEWRGEEPSFDVYLDIKADGIVTLWQRITTREWELYYSSVSIDDSIISGVYSDGVAWSTSYGISLGEDSMTWVATNDSSDVSVYVPAELPTDLPAESHEATRAVTRFL